MGTERNQATVARQAAAYLKHKYRKPGNAFVGVVSRLDRLVSGVLILARTSKAASRLSEQIRSRQVQKRYLACVEGRLEAGNEADASGWREVTHWVCKDERHQKMRTLESKPEVGTESSGAKEARLRFRWLANDTRLTLVEVDLLTGRKHQIRLQLSELGHPVLGDAKYGSNRRFPSGIALHCSRVCILHPTRRQPLEFSASPRQHWRQHVPESLLAAIL